MFQFPLLSNSDTMRSRLMYSTQTYICCYTHHGRISPLVYRREKCFNQMLLLKIRHMVCTLHFLRSPDYFRENLTIVIVMLFHLKTRELFSCLCPPHVFTLFGERYRKLAFTNSRTLGSNRAKTL